MVPKHNYHHMVGFYGKLAVSYGNRNTFNSKRSLKTESLVLLLLLLRISVLRCVSMYLWSCSVRVFFVLFFLCFLTIVVMLVYKAKKS